MLADSSGVALQTVSNELGCITFAPLSYDQTDIGQTYTYTVYELEDERVCYETDTQVYTVTVAVGLDEADGTLTLTKTLLRDGQAVEAIRFNNTYTATGSLQLTAEKTVNGAEPAEGKVFDFLLEGEGVSLTARNEGGSVIFDEITYDLADAGQTFTYTVRETTASAGTMTADSSVYTVMVTVIDNGDGTLTASPVITLAGEEVDSIAFNNIIEAPLTISKTVTGYATDRPFPMNVWFYDAEGNELTSPVAFTGVEEGEVCSGDFIFLSHGQSITFTSLLPGMRYVVEEWPDDAYTTVVNGLPMNRVEGECLEGGNRADFVNRMHTTSFSVTKVWEGGSGPIRLTIYADGVKMDPQPPVLRDGDVYVCSGLPMYDEDGNKVVYSAKEKYMDGFMTIYDNEPPYDGESSMVYDGGVIINRAVTTLRVCKLWKGLPEDVEPPEIILTLYCNGEPFNKRQPEPDEHGWYVYENLPLSWQGEPATYYVVEEDCTGFAAIYENADGTGGNCAYDNGVITNVAMPATGDSGHLAFWFLTATLAAAALLMLRRRHA